MRNELIKKKRWVIKLGTSSLIGATGNFSADAVERIVAQVVMLLQRQYQVLLVSSGAIALGMETLEKEKRPRDLAELQACAAIGQGKLMAAYETAFSKHGYHVAQILLTRDGLQQRKRYVNAKNTILELLKMGIVPIVNENDTVATEEIRFGDNDILAAQVANLMEADLIIFLSDIEGLYLRDKTLIRQITNANELKDYASHIHSKKSEKTAGGMKAKLEAARVAMRCGIPIVLANGRDGQVVDKLLKGEEVGSLFHPEKRKLNARKKWLVHSASIKGAVQVDAGARRALIELNKSLLPGGITECRGAFEVGDLVQILDEYGEAFARGLVNYGASEVNKIKGKKTKEISSMLGYKRTDEVIHRDNLGLL